MTSHASPQAAPPPVHPVRLTAVLDARLSRWLWLVKWLLALPHYLVLVVLWAACALVSVVAFFAVLFTGHYPRALFDFTAGVLRWSWRVGYYAGAALGTDRYPPFTLADVPDYPARLEVAYPKELSRGLVLVKWWLLALPHYVVLGFLCGGPRVLWASGGLISVLVFFAGVALLFTGVYPRGIFELVTGLNRWTVRVLVYALLLTDVYPPFRLDQGGADPQAVASPPV
ncbi:DUF4389 domain-containing protein [Streptomyces niveiscabiei]|uniref:DUF4389 domain-containing protein n=1 Tax=Streptomyces niveiscabiei TaxID=164115 RepID=UPI0029AE779E|nr:DUF4389 domain-containing protein [Streptomyces niveiscabiei]MDX3387220.1 DUF4389 domain-containing protein [Streptomyces niveiscabiei]